MTFELLCRMVTNDTPKAIEDLLESLRNHTDLLEPKPGCAPEVSEILDYDRPMQPHTETSYVPDLTQGEFQPLEELSDDDLMCLDEV